MELDLWFLFAVTFVAALAIPGPNAAYVIAQTLNRGTDKGVLASSGFALASGLNIAIVLSGLGLIMSQFIDILFYLKWAGVIYLLYLAYKAFTANPTDSGSQQEVKNSHIFGFAVFISLTNPKVLLGNLLILPLFINSSTPFLLQAIIITITGTVLSFMVYSAYALIASKFIRKLKTKTASRIVGSIYTGAGIALASMSK